MSGARHALYAATAGTTGGGSGTDPGGTGGTVYFDANIKNNSDPTAGYDLWQQEGGGTVGSIVDPFLNERVMYLAIPGGSGTKRSQAETPKGIWTKGGPVRWCGFGFRVDSNFPSPVDNWSKIESIYGEPWAGSENRMVGNSRSTRGGIQGNRLEPGPQWQVSTPPGQWYGILMRIKLSSSVGATDGNHTVYVSTSASGYVKIYENLNIDNVASSMSDGPYDQRLVFYTGGGYPSGTHRHYFARHRVASTAVAANPGIFGETNVPSG